MTPHFDSPHATVWHGDCIDVMRGLPDGSVDAVVTDPPYALEFMGRGWDKFTPLEFELWCCQWATEAFRLLKPGGHLLAFGGTRTFHRLTAGIEDAGFEIRDSIAWMYGSGFPKSLDVSKAIDKQLGAEREVVGYDASKARPNKVKFAKLPEGQASAGSLAGVQDNGATLTAPATEQAAAWTGWGTALKPAFEPIVVARKPLTGTVAANVLAHGTGALNIDTTRIGAGQDYYEKTASVVGLSSGHGYSDLGGMPRTDSASQLGRWPANVVLDEHQAAALDAQSGVLTSGGGDRGTTSRDGLMGPESDRGRATRYSREPDMGGASRFFYTAKAGTDERPSVDGVAHPTVKPLDLMRWLVRLVTPKGGTVLEPFAGSGTTVEACIREGFRCIAIEREATYLPLIMQRLDKPHAVGLDFGDWEDAS